MSRLATLMISLIYPASLGAGIVWLLTELAEARLDAFCHPGSYYGIWLLIYFSIGFTVLSKELAKRGTEYQKLQFFMDLGDICLIFLCFFFLGHVAASQSYDYKAFCWAASVAPVLQSAWNVAFKTDNRLAWVFVFGASGIFLIGALCLGKFQWYQWGALIPLSILLELYRRERVAD